MPLVLPRIYQRLCFHYMPRGLTVLYYIPAEFNFTSLSVRAVIIMHTRYYYIYRNSCYHLISLKSLDSIETVDVEWENGRTLTKKGKLLVSLANKIIYINYLISANCTYLQPGKIHNFYKAVTMQIENNEMTKYQVILKQVSLKFSRKKTSVTVCSIKRGTITPYNLVSRDSALLFQVQWILQV